MHSITYRIATGAQAGRKVTTLQTIPADADAPEGDADKVGGFSLHAGVAAEAHESQKLERLCSYIACPAINEKRLSLSPQGRVRYQLKTPWKNGTTHVAFEPVEFIAKLAALVPPSRAHLTRFHGVFTPGFLPFALRATLRLFKFARANLCAKREVARAADAIGARQTASHRRRISGQALKRAQSDACPDCSAGSAAEGRSIRAHCSGGRGLLQWAA